MRRHTNEGGQPRVDLAWSVSLLRVYLDQNAWIKLSRQHYGRGDDDRVAGVLALVHEVSRAGRASFPLSGAHYIETYRRGDPSLSSFLCR